MARKKNILVIGGGFAGVSALRQFARNRGRWRSDFDLTLVDRKTDSEFLPMLPDIAGGRISPEALKTALAGICGRYGAIFVNDEVRQLDLAGKKAVCSGTTIDFEYAIISSGAETNYFGKDEFKSCAFGLYSVADAFRLRKEMVKRARNGTLKNLVIAGGGYTGVEVASNARYLSRKIGKDINILIVEKADDILTMLPARPRDTAKKELAKMNIKIKTGDSIGSVKEDRIFLASGGEIPKALCVWTAGVKTSDFVSGVPGEKERGRIKTDEYLRIKDLPDVSGIFVAGDSASFYDGRINGSLRMAVMFAMGQGKTAAKNVINSINKASFVKYSPVDLGYVIPLASGKGPGIIIGKTVPPCIGYLMHYFMCLYRSGFVKGLEMLKYWVFPKKDIL